MPHSTAVQITGSVTGHRRTASAPLTYTTLTTVNGGRGITVIGADAQIGATPPTSSRELHTQRPIRGPAAEDRAVTLMGSGHQNAYVERSTQSGNSSHDDTQDAPRGRAQLHLQETIGMVGDSRDISGATRNPANRQPHQTVVMFTRR